MGNANLRLHQRKCLLLLLILFFILVDATGGNFVGRSPVLASAGQLGSGGELQCERVQAVAAKRQMESGVKDSAAKWQRGVESGGEKKTPWGRRGGRTGQGGSVGVKPRRA